MKPLHDAAVDHLRRMTRQPELVDDRFEILGVIGQGGMGTVYRTRDHRLEREVALKVIRPELTDEATTRRLERESQVLARLDHPGVVPIHDVGQLADGRVYYLMRLVDGRRLDQVPQETSLAERLRLFLRIAETIEFAHSRGVIHRDLKPANIMLGAFGEVLVLDWGIARVADLPEDSGTVLGTPGFMAPEQALGDPTRIDHRTDVYGLGAILQWLTSNQAAPRSLGSICRRALAPNPADRYDSVRALAADVTRFLDGAPVTAHRETVVERLERFYRKYQMPILLVVAYLVMRLLFLVLRGPG